MKNKDLAMTSTKLLRFVTLCIAKNRFTESGLDRIGMQNESHIYNNQESRNQKEPT